MSSTFQGQGHFSIHNSWSVTWKVTWSKAYPVVVCEIKINKHQITGTFYDRLKEKGGWFFPLSKYILYEIQDKWHKYKNVAHVRE